MTWFWDSQINGNPRRNPSKHHLHVNTSSKAANMAVSEEIKAFVEEMVAAEFAAMSSKDAGKSLDVAALVVAWSTLV